LIDTGDSKLVRKLPGLDPSGIAAVPPDASSNPTSAEVHQGCRDAGWYQRAFCRGRCGFGRERCYRAHAQAGWPATR